MPPLLRPCGYAHLCRQPGGKVQLEQERVWNGAEQLLLGLLLHPSVRGLRQRQVRNKEKPLWVVHRVPPEWETPVPAGLEAKRSSCSLPQPGARWRPSPPSWPTSAPSRSSQWPFPASSWACCKVRPLARWRSGEGGGTFGKWPIRRLTGLPLGNITQMAKRGR